MYGLTVSCTRPVGMAWGSGWDSAWIHRRGHIILLVLPWCVFRHLRVASLSIYSRHRCAASGATSAKGGAQGGAEAVQCN